MDRTGKDSPHIPMNVVSLSLPGTVYHAKSTYKLSLLSSRARTASIASFCSAIGSLQRRVAVGAVSDRDDADSCGDLLCKGHGFLMRELYAGVKKVI